MALTEKELEARREKARNLRYKKPIAKAVNLDSINETLWEMQTDIADVRWMAEDDELLLQALDDDDEQVFEFKIAFSDLGNDLERMQDDLQEQWVPECFDIFFPAIGTEGGLMGYDEIEGDYFGLEPWEDQAAEREAKDKLKRLTKDQLIEAAGVCMRIAMQYIALVSRFDQLKSAIDILKGQNEGFLEIVKTIEAQYEAADKSSDGFKWKFDQQVAKLDALLHDLPDRLWLE